MQAAFDSPLDCATGCSNAQVKGIAQLDYATVSINAHCFDYKEGHLGLRLGDNRTVTRAATISDPPVDAPLLVSLGPGARAGQGTHHCHEHS